MNLIWHFKKFDELTPKELYEIIQLRVNVFMIEQNCLYNECDGKDLYCHQLWCTFDGKIIGSSRIVPPGISYADPSVGRVVSHPEFRQLKLGYQLMRHSLEVIENLYGNTPVKISAQSYLKNFYEKFGFEQVSEEYLEDDLPHMEMLKE